MQPDGSTDVDVAPVILAPEVTVFVHEVDATVHPQIGEGIWRWAVHVGGRPPHELRWCVQAGGERSMTAACEMGDQVAAAATLGLRAFEIPASPPRLIILSHDPIPAGRDTIRHMGRG